MNRRSLTLSVWLAVLLVAGCNTLDKQAVGVTMIVDRAMTAWAGYVVEARTSGSVPRGTLSAQEATVREAYGKYQRCMDAYDAMRKFGDKGSLNAALEDADDAAMALSVLINDFLKEKP